MYIDIRRCTLSFLFVRSMLIVVFCLYDVRKRRPRAIHQGGQERSLLFRSLCVSISALLIYYPAVHVDCVCCSARMYQSINGLPGSDSDMPTTSLIAPLPTYWNTGSWNSQTTIFSVMLVQVRAQLEPTPVHCPNLELMSVSRKYFNYC